jgi:hypothetical protein
MCPHTSQVEGSKLRLYKQRPVVFVSTRKTKSNKEKHEGTIRALGDLFVAAVRCVCLVVIEVPASSYTRSCVTRIRRVVLPLDRRVVARSCVRSWAKLTIGIRAKV